MMQLARSVLAFFLLGGLLLSPVRAGPQPIPDLRLLVDVSASMQRLDPEQRRIPTLETVIRLLPAGARASIWVFDEEVRELVPAAPVDGPWREQAIAALAGGLEQGGARSDIPAALAAATADLLEPDPAYRGSVILLTAGGVNVADSPMVNVSAARKLLDELAVELGEGGVPVHTIALSREADSQLLRSLAQQTGGSSAQAVDASELGEVFLDTLEQVLPAVRLPVFGREFSIDPGVSEFVVLARLPRLVGKLYLLAPDGSLYSAEDNPADIRWFRNEHLSIARVSSPAPGSWRLRYPENSSARVYVDAEVALELEPLPPYVSVGEEARVSLSLLVGGKRVSDPDLLARYTFLLELISPGGDSEGYRLSAADSDGLLTTQIGPFEEAGRYQVIARLEGEGIARELALYLTVGLPAEQPTLVTRGETLLEDDFRAPLIWLAGAISSVLVLLWYILHRRKQRKLALWQKRAREMRKSGKRETLGGAPAVSAEQEREHSRSLD